MRSLSVFSRHDRFFQQVMSPASYHCSTSLKILKTSPTSTINKATKNIPLHRTTLINNPPCRPTTRKPVHPPTISINSPNPITAAGHSSWNGSSMNETCGKSSKERKRGLKSQPDPHRLQRMRQQRRRQQRRNINKGLRTSIRGPR